MSEWEWRPTNEDGDGFYCTIDHGRTILAIRKAEKKWEVRTSGGYSPYITVVDETRQKAFDRLIAGLEAR